MEDNNFYEDNDNGNDKISKTRVITNALSISLGIVISVVVLVSLYVIVKPSILGEAYTSKVFTTEQLERLEQAAYYIEKYYLYDYDLDDMIDGAIEGMVDSLDNVFTYYEDEEEYQESLDSGANGSYVGIGVHLSYDKNTEGIKVLGVMPNSPAEEAGIKAGDVILKVDDLYVTLDTYVEAVDAIKGDEGTTVTLQILRGDELIEITSARAEITENNVSSEIIDGIGYIRIFSFDNGIYDQFKEVYDDIMNQGITGLVIDLRNNPGGLVSDTIDILNLLLPEVKVVRLVTKDGDEKAYYTDSENEITIPLAVLVNGNSASASELFASAIKDSGKGVVIGTQTFGKGVVQYVLPITGHGAILLVSAQYFTSSGVVIQDNGIEPDIIVELSEDIANNLYIDKAEDLQLQEALNYINSQL